MNPLTPEAALEVWERGRNLNATGRALTLLAAADLETEAASLGHLALGERDRRLLELRAATLGPEMTACSSCPGCVEAVEVGIRVEDLLALGPTQGMTHHLSLEQGSVHFRLPTSDDLEVAAAAPDLAATEDVLLDRCVGFSDPAALQTLSSGDRAALGQAMSAADPLAEITLDLRCADCGESWQEPFEIAEFFFEEVTQHARGLLREISLLARGYGWREVDVLAMSPFRRRAYRELLGA